MLTCGCVDCVSSLIVVGRIFTYLDTKQLSPYYDMTLSRVRFISIMQCPDSHVKKFGTYLMKCGLSYALMNGRGNE